MLIPRICVKMGGGNWRLYTDNSTVVLRNHNNTWACVHVSTEIEISSTSTLLLSPALCRWLSLVTYFCIHSPCVLAAVGGRAGSGTCFPPRSLVASTPLLQHLAGKDGAELFTCAVSESAGRELKSLVLSDTSNTTSSHFQHWEGKKEALLGRVFVALFTVPSAWNSTVP